MNNCRLLIILKLNDANISWFTVHNYKQANIGLQSWEGDSQNITLTVLTYQSVWMYIQ